MSEKLEKILDLVSEYINDKDISWTAGEDWVSYSGPQFDDKEYRAAIEVLLSGWLIFGEKSREFEKTFSPHLGKTQGCLTNSGSSANLLAVSALRSKNGFNLPEGSKIIRRYFHLLVLSSPSHDYGRGRIRSNKQRSTK